MERPGDRRVGRRLPRGVRAPRGRRRGDVLRAALHDRQRRPLGRFRDGDDDLLLQRAAARPGARQRCTRDRRRDAAAARRHAAVRIARAGEPDPAGGAHPDPAAAELGGRPRASDDHHVRRAPAGWIPRCAGAPEPAERRTGRLLPAARRGTVPGIRRRSREDRGLGMAGGVATRRAAAEDRRPGPPGRTLCMSARCARTKEWGTRWRRFTGSGDSSTCGSRCGAKVPTRAGCSAARDGWGSAGAWCSPACWRWAPFEITCERLMCCSSRAGRATRRGFHSSSITPYVRGPPPSSRRTARLPGAWFTAAVRCCIRQATRMRSLQHSSSWSRTLRCTAASPTRPLRPGGRSKLNSIGASWSARGSTAPSATADSSRAPSRRTRDHGFSGHRAPPPLGPAARGLGGAWAGLAEPRATRSWFVPRRQAPARLPQPLRPACSCAISPGSSTAHVRNRYGIELPWTVELGRRRCSSTRAAIVVHGYADDRRRLHHPPGSDDR